MLLFAALCGQAQERKSIVQLADPFILLDDGTYYAYGTYDANGIAVWQSTDLKGWRKRAYLALDKENTTEKQWFWAPEVYYLNGQYYMYFSANEHLFVATSSKPTGPFKQVGDKPMLYSILGDEKSIDSTLFIDEDTGKIYFFFVRFNDGNCIWVCELEDDYITPKANSLKKCINVTNSWESYLGRVTEGPFVIKHNKIFYLTYSANDYQSQDYAVGYAYARNIITTGNGSTQWIKYPNNPIVRRVENLVGTGHHSFFTDKEGNMRIVFHAHDSETAIHPRRMYIGKMEFNGNALKLSDEPILRPMTPTQASVDDLMTDDPVPVSYYDVAGRRLSQPLTDGITLVRMSDGTMRKLAY